MGQPCITADTRVCIFGQIHADEIRTIEARYAGAWHRYPVAGPGYVIRLPEEPTAYRWLDAEGEVVASKSDAVVACDGARITVCRNVNPEY